MTNVNIDNVEAEITAFVRQTQAPVRRIEREHTNLPVSPDYVHPNPEVSEGGRLSAQAMAMEYEKAARAMESTAHELVALAQRCDQDCMVVIENNEQVHAKIDAVVAECRETAASYRQEAKAIFDQIQNASLIVDDVRRTMQAAIHRIRTRELPAAPATPETDADTPDEAL